MKASPQLAAALTIVLGCGSSSSDTAGSPTAGQGGTSTSGGGGATRATRR